MSKPEIKLTANRILWLRKLESMNAQRGNFIRDGAVTRHSKSDRKMPEPVYCWLVEHRLIGVDCGNIQLTERGEKMPKLRID